MPDPAPSTTPAREPASTPAPAPTSTPAPATATFLQVCGAVFWSFFGVRKGRAMAQDAVTIRPVHVIVVGLLAGAAFIATLLVIVRLVLRSAGA
jgi:hypothetical protein